MRSTYFANENRLPSDGDAILSDCDKYFSIECDKSKKTISQFGL